MVEYTIYQDTNYDVCRTASPEQTNLTGVQWIERRTEDAVYSDRFHVIEKIKSVYDKESKLWYDFYSIDRHTQSVDYTPKFKTDIDEISANTDEMLVNQEYRLTLLELGGESNAV